MATEFKLPELGENIDSGDLVRLMISPGASIAEGQAVMELETDKAVIEVPSSVSGTVGEVRVKEGDKLRVGPSTRMVNQVPTHGSGSNSEKMLPVPPIPILGRNHPEVDLIDQFRGLHGVALTLALHQVTRQAP